MFLTSFVSSNLHAVVMLRLWTNHCFRINQFFSEQVVNKMEEKIDQLFFTMCKMLKCSFWSVVADLYTYILRIIRLVFLLWIGWVNDSKTNFPRLVAKNNIISHVSKPADRVSTWIWMKLFFIWKNRLSESKSPPISFKISAVLPQICQFTGF